MAPKKKAAAKKASPKAASSGAGKKAVPETAPTAAASSSPVSSPAKACASPSTAKKTAPAAVAGGKKVRRRRQPLDIVLADNPSPACLSVVASALSADEARLVTARSNGSIAVHRILLHKRAGGSGSSKNRRNKKKAAAATAGEDDTGATEEAVAVEGPSKRIFNVLMVASTGGRPDAVPTDVLFMGAKDEFVVAAFGSGAFVVYDAVSLAPICSSRRVGGVARSIARSGKLDFFAAVSDGSVRRWQIVRDSKAGSTELRMVQTIPKAVGCERALCVAVDKDLALVVVGDDSRSVTAWELTAVDDLRATTQQWSLQLPNSFPLALALHGNALAIGTSMNEVVFAEPSAGIIVNTFEHHKGPVTTLAAAGGVFYASGWHDSIRAYRANTEESENVAQRQRRRERDAVNNTTAADRAGASDYAPAEVKRRTHYHEVTGICVGVKTGLFISTARDGTILYANLERFFSSPASYVDSQVSVKPHTLAGGDLLFTHRDNSVEVHRVLPHALMPLVNYTLDSSANVRGLWPNTEGTRVCIATDERVTVLSLDVDRDKNTVGVRRLVCSPIPAANAACFSDAETLLVGAGSAVLVLRFDDATVKANTAEGKVAFAKAGAKRVATKTVDEATGEVSTERIKAAASLSCVTQCFSSPALEGTITFMAAPLAETNGHCFVATQQPAAVHWLAMAPSGASIVDVAINEKVDSISHAPLKGKDAGAVSFLNVTDSRHYVATRPGAAGKKIVAVTTAEAPLPLNATIHGRSTILEGPHTNANAPFVASFANGIVDIRSSGDRWNYTRPADRVKAAPNDIKARVEFAAFEPKAAAAPWTSGSAEVAKELEALRKRATKKHRSERATIALDGEASDAEGSDDEAVLEAHIEERKAAEARGESGAVDATFALRRNVPALVQGLPLAWRVRRFGN